MKKSAFFLLIVLALTTACGGKTPTALADAPAI
jgi:predicted small lipoprotein YifL